MFTQEYVLNYIGSGTHPKLVECIAEVLKRIDTLKSEQVAGLFAAAFVLGDTVWTEAIKALCLMDNKTK